MHSYDLMEISRNRHSAMNDYRLIEVILLCKCDESFEAVGEIEVYQHLRLPRYAVYKCYSGARTLCIEEYFDLSRVQLNAVLSTSAGEQAMVNSVHH